MRASLFLCPLKRVVRVTSPAPLSFAPAGPTGPDPCPGLAPGLRPCRARYRPPRRALGSSPPLGRLRRKRLRRSGFAAFWTPSLRGPVCTGDRAPDSLNAIAGDQRVAIGFVNRLCRWTLPSQPPPTLDPAVIPPISCSAQAPSGRLRPAGLWPASSRLSRAKIYTSRSPYTNRCE